MHIDDLINFLNQRWTFKILIFLILSFPTFQFYGQLQNILLALVKPEFKCIQNITIGKQKIDPSQCTIRNILTNTTIPCTKWKFSDKPVGRTMVSDYKLICDRQPYNDIVLIAWYLTALTGPIQGWLADRYGRKKLAIFNLSLEVFISILTIFSPNITINIILRVLLGVSTSGVYICFSWLSEMVDYNYRIFVGSFYWTFGCAAYMIFPLIVYFTRDWRSTQGYTIIPSFLYLFVLFVPESPRWYYIVGNKKESLRSLKIMSRVNKLDKSIKLDSILNENIDKNMDNIDKNTSILYALKSDMFLKRLVITFFLQFSTYMFYSAVTVNLNILHNDIFISMFLIGCMEMPGLFLSYATLKFMSRRKSTILWSCVGSILFLFSVFFRRSVYWESIVRMILGSFAKIAIACLNQVTMVYITELFPTCHRTFGVIVPQIANFMAFIGAVYINRLDQILFFLPILIYSIQLWISCILVLFTLPNTRNLPIPESLQDQRMLRLGCEKEYLDYMKNKTSEIEATVKDNIDDDDDDDRKPIVNYYDDLKTDTEDDERSNLLSNEK